jgi:hypothetical protein
VYGRGGDSHAGEGEEEGGGRRPHGGVPYRLRVLTLPFDRSSKREFVRMANRWNVRLWGYREVGWHERGGLEGKSAKGSGGRGSSEEDNVALPRAILEQIPRLGPHLFASLSTSTSLTRWLSTRWKKLIAEGELGGVAREG